MPNRSFSRGVGSSKWKTKREKKCDTKKQNTTTPTLTKYKRKKIDLETKMTHSERK